MLTRGVPDPSFLQPPFLPLQELARATDSWKTSFQGHRLGGLAAPRPPGPRPLLHTPRPHEFHTQVGAFIPALALVITMALHLDRFHTASVEFRRNSEAGLGTLICKGITKHYLHLGVCTIIHFTYPIWLQPETSHNQQYHIYTCIINAL